MKSKRYVFFIMIFMGLPVSGDAATPCVATPVLSLQHRAFHDRLPWMTAFFPLMMTACLLSVGSLSSRIGELSA